MRVIASTAVSGRQTTDTPTGHNARLSGSVDLDRLRTFVVAAEAGQLREAALDLGVTQQAVSKRVAALERALGVALFVRTVTGVQLTADGAVFLPRAREVLRAVERAVLSVQPGGRALRVDVTHRRIAPAAALQAFHSANPDVGLDVVTLAENHLAGALDAVRDGSIDATFRAVPAPHEKWPDELRATRALDSELELLTGPHHPLARHAVLTPAQLAGHRIWIPGIVPGTEWARFYRDFAAAFGLTIDGVGPHFGDEALLESLATAADLATIVGAGDRYLWPSHYGLRRIPLRDPTPVYPHCLVWSAANAHPGLGELRTWLAAARTARPRPGRVWEPSWS